MFMFDTHIHLDFESYDADREEVISRFFSQGGKAIVNVGVDEQRIEKSLEIASGHEKIFVAAGFHPQEIVDLRLSICDLGVEKNRNENRNFDIKKYLRGVIESNREKVVAVGEIGLDYFHPSGRNYDLKVDDEIKRIQKEAFAEQLEVAREFKLPAVIHSWDAENDCFEILKNFLDLKIVFHCYGKNIPLEFTKKLLKHENIFFSFTGNITFPRPGKSGSEIFEHIKIIPLERMMVETDGPFLTPVPHRGKRNEPAYVKHVIEKIAGIKEIGADEVEKVTDENAVGFFGLKFSNQ